MAVNGHNERLRVLADRQQGRVTVAQMGQLGMAAWEIAQSIERAHLKPVLPRVYAVGHTAPSREADLWAAVLYAGPGAMLSHATGAHWRGLIDYPPSEIEVSTPRQVKSHPGVRVYARRRGLEREIHNGIPVTAVPMMMADLAATNGPGVVKRALSQLDFQRRFDPAALLAACGSGVNGSVALREAVFNYDPRLKYANGRLEVDFYELCTSRGLPLPRLNVRVHGILVDAYWEEAALVVELDSEKAHSSPARRARDRRNDLKLRSHGLAVHRYDWVLVHEQWDAVCADVLRALERGMRERRERRLPAGAQAEPAEHQ